MLDHWLSEYVNLESRHTWSLYVQFMGDTTCRACSLDLPITTGDRSHAWAIFKRYALRRGKDCTYTAGVMCVVKTASAQPSFCCKELQGRNPSLFYCISFPYSSQHSRDTAVEKRSAFQWYLIHFCFKKEVLLLSDIVKSSDRNLVI